MIARPSIRSATISDRIGALVFCVLLISFYVALSVERESLTDTAVRLAPMTGETGNA
jgi:hypothetical protein